jgi:hypothetical protein
LRTDLYVPQQSVTPDATADRRNFAQFKGLPDEAVARPDWHRPCVTRGAASYARSEIMQTFYALSSPQLVIAWMGAILIGAGIPAVAALVRSAGRTRRPAPVRRHPRTA